MNAVPTTYGISLINQSIHCQIMAKKATHIKKKGGRAGRRQVSIAGEKKSEEMHMYLSLE